MAVDADVPHSTGEESCCEPLLDGPAAGLQLLMALAGIPGERDPEQRIVSMLEAPGQHVHRHREAVFRIQPGGSLGAGIGRVQEDGAWMLQVARERLRRRPRGEPGPVAVQDSDMSDSG